MRKKGLAKSLSFLLAASMVAPTVAPASVFAAQEPTVEETEALAEEPEASEEAEESVVPVKARGQARAARQDAIYDAWTQDEITVKGEDAVNEIYSNAFLHLVAGSSNGNAHNNANQYPAFFVNPNTFNFDEAGYFEFTLFPGAAPSNTRFGIMLGYQNPGNGMFLGYDAGGWYWQKYSGGDGDYYSGTRVSAPASGTYTNVRIEWTGDHKVSMKLQNAENSSGTSSAEWISVFTDEDFSGIAESLGNQIGIKCGTYSGNATNIYLKNIGYGEGESAVHTLSGRVTDSQGNPLEGALIEMNGQSATTDAEGQYTLETYFFANSYTVTVSKAGYATSTKTVTYANDGAVIMDAQLQVIETKTISSDEMDVVIDSGFPSVFEYHMKGGDLEGKTFYGQPQAISTIQINGTSIDVTKDNLEATFDSDKATYVMALKDEAAHVDCVITAELKVVKNTVEFNVTDVVNNLKDTDNKGQEVYPVQRINIPNHSLISVRSDQENANLKGAKVSSHTLISGDQSVDITDDMTFTSEDFVYGFVSNNEMSAGLWSNAEYEGTYMAAHVNGGSRNTRVMATTSELNGVKSVGLGSTEWYYDRKITPTVNGLTQTYVVEHDEMPSAKVAIAGDLNEDAQIDWQDGAIAFREIMNNPYKSEEVPELVNQRIAMNFGSQAANPFLTNLDGVKRVYLSTDGLGQSVLLKGYGSEGHDSGHPDYGNIGERIGGAEDMNTLLVEGKKYGAVFGVHINASEMYTEAKAFNDELSRGNYGWNWLDQGIGINGLYDLGSGAREQRLAELKEQVGDNLDFIYLDVWGNLTSGTEDSWETRKIARQINDNGWRFTTEWGATGEYDSTLQHWAADLSYGGANAKGQNSEVMRFLRNHQKDSWVADYPTYSGAAEAPLLGGLTMTDFEGWQGRVDYDNYIKVMFRHNVITKFLQHYKVMKWVDGDPVTMSNSVDGTCSWIPEMAITLQSDDKEQTVEVTRDSNDYENDRMGYRSRTIKLNGTVISQGARTNGDGTESTVIAGDEAYLIPWFWAADGTQLSEEDQKLYHWNTQGGTTTWDLIDEWQNLDNVVVYKLTDEGKTDERVVDVVNGQITLEDIEAETAYVVYKGEKAQLDVDWQSSKYIYDMGFNDGNLTNYWTIAGEGTAQIVDNVASNNMLKLEGEVSATSKALTNLKPGQRYAVYIGVDNRSDAKAHMTIKSGDTVLADNYTEKSFVQNMVSSDQHNMKNGATVGRSSYFQNMYVFFTAPESGDVTLTLSREAGDEATYFDDVRVVETKMDLVKGVDENGYVTKLYQDFENNEQGIYPFVISGPGQGYSGWVTDNRIHLSEAHAPYSNAGYKDKRVDDVLDGNWSVKINGLSQNSSMIYQTIPQNFRFEPGESYYVSFDYQLGSEGTYEIRIGDGTNNNVGSVAMPAAIGKTGRFGFTFTASESGQSWFGIYSTSTAADMQDLASAGDGAKNFSGYKDFILDNLKIQKGVSMAMSESKIVTTSAQDAFQLEVDFQNEEDQDKQVIWKSSDEEIAWVDDNGLVRFNGYGTATISATADFDGEEVSVYCVVTLLQGADSRAEYVNAWANTQESSGEDGRAVNVTDYNSSTIWHSQWTGSGFSVSESNPAIITVQMRQDISEFETVTLQQRSGSNGLVQTYECIVGDSFDSFTHTITDGVSTGVVTAANTSSGTKELIQIPEGATGHYLQIRVLKGSNNYASIADITATTSVSYVTEENEKARAINQIRMYVAKAAALDSEDYTTVSWKKLNAAVEEAKALLENEAATKDQIDSVLAACREAMDNLATNENAFTVTFDANGGTKVTESMTVAKGETYGTLPKTSRVGYTFLGWYYGTEKVTEGTVCDLDADATLTAKWEDTLIAFMEKLDGSQFSKESWAAFEAALTHAKEVDADADSTRAEINEARAALLAAYGNLEYGVQKQHLQAALEAARAVLDAASNYEEESMAALKKVVDEAQVVLDDENAAQEAVNAAAGAVLDALAEVKGNKDVESLKSLINAAESLIGSKYTDESLAVLESAIEFAKEVAENVDREESDLSKAYKQLAEAIRGLEMKGNKAALGAMIDKANEILDNASAYVESSISGLAAVLEEAQAVYSEENATQPEVSAATEALTLEVVKARLKGDVDRDGKVGTKDSAEVLKYSAELTGLTGEQLEGADVNGDGKVDTKDAVLILQYASEKISAF